MGFAEVLAIVLKVIWPLMSGIATGVCLGIGFWIAKLITSKLDEWRVLSDKQFMSELATASI
jgi:hypothetical protein